MAIYEKKPLRVCAYHYRKEFEDKYEPAKEGEKHGFINGENI